MNSSLISKVQKARIYAAEHERIRINGFTCRVRGDNSSHAVSLIEGELRCDCLFYRAHAACSHTMAMQRVMHDMLPEELQPAHPSPVTA